MASKKKGTGGSGPEEKKFSTLTKDMMNTIDPVAIEDEMKDSYMTYSMSVIISRALTDVRDGLKPVHRRILYAMHSLGMKHNNKFKKSATTVGEVLGKYHPHGDSAVYDSMVRLAQNFSMRYMLVEGQGNFGSIDGDPPAAMRYTESRMRKLAEEMLKDIEKETVDFMPNFDDTREEPSVLPAAVPNLLINGSTGIAVGMSSNMPPHNLRETINAIIAYIDDMDISIESLMKHMPGPDFPTAGIIYGKDGIKKAYNTGRGKITLRAKLDIETDKRGKDSIVITEIPYMVNKTALIERIASLVKDSKIEGVSGIKDFSDRRGMKIVIELKKGVMTQIVLNQLYKNTQLETTFGIINLALVRGEPKILTLKELIKHFVDHRVDVVTRRTKFDLNKAEARAHIVEGLLIAQANIDEIIRIIRESQSTEEARNKLMGKFKLSELQAQAILDMQLKRLTALEKLKLEQELEELKKLIAYYKDLLSNHEKMMSLIKKELNDISEEYGDERRSEIIGKTDDLEIDEDDLIHDEDVVISVTQQGFVKRVLASSFRAQSRGGVGVQLGKPKGEDYFAHLFAASTKDTIFFFTDKGKAFWLKAHELPQMAKSAQGKSIKFILNLMPNERITSYLTLRDISSDGQSIVMITKKGVLKKMDPAQLTNAKKRGILALNLDSDDELIDTSIVNAKDDFIMTSASGLALRVNEEKIRRMGRAAGGVKGMNLAESDHCVSITGIKKGESLIVLTDKGLGKRLLPGRFNVKGRGGKGQIYMKLDTRTGDVARVKAAATNDDIMVVTSEGMLIKMHSNDISEMGRNAKGVKVVNIKAPDKVIDMGIVPAGE